MATTIPSATLVPITPVFTNTERARATITRRLCTVGGFYLKDPSSWRPMGAGSIAPAPGGSSGASPAARGSPRPLGLTRCATHSSPPRWTPGSHSAMCRKPRPTLTRGPRCAMTGPAPRWTATPPTSSPRRRSRPVALPNCPPGWTLARRTSTGNTERYIRRAREPPNLGGNLDRQSDCRYRARTAVRLAARGKQVSASLTCLPLAGRACIAAAMRFHAAAQIAHRTIMRC